MKKDDFLKDLHIGKIIKKIASQKGVPPQDLATVINRYQQNANKIFCINDMDVEDLVNISYLLGYNILEYISRKYLPHLSCSENLVSTESYRCDNPNHFEVYEVGAFLVVC